MTATPTSPAFREGERRLAAVAFTDIVGYSALVNRDDANAMRLVEEHFALVREIAARFGGRVIKTIGDSVHLEFSSAQAATACSIAIQQAHQRRNTRVEAERRFDVRIGIHTGDVEHRSGDVYGDGVNIAARLQPLAPVGGIAISDHVRGQLRLDLRNRFVSRGTPALRNIETPIELFVLDGDVLAGIAVDAPAPEVSATPPPAPPAPNRRLPIVVATMVVAAALAIAVFLVPQLRSPDQADVSDHSIAVLPFANLSSDKEQEFFSDGISEDLLNLLTRVATLQVAARTSSFSFKGQNVEIPEIARRLHVAHLLQGSVRKSGNSVRITAQLVRAKDGFQVWSQSWDRQLDDVFKIQDEIAQAVVEQLKVQLLGAAPTAKPVDPRVYPMILQAEMLLAQYSPDSLRRAVTLYEQAIAIAPNEARAHAGLGRILINQLSGGQIPVAEGARSAREAANKALDLDPSNVVALATLGGVTFYVDWDLPATARYFEHARTLEPANPMVLNQLANFLMLIGRWDEAAPIYDYRIATDPTNPAAYNNLGNFSYFARRWEGSIEAYRTALRLSPGVVGAHYTVGAAILLGRKDAAAALKEFEIEPDESLRLGGEPLALHALGRFQEADERVKVLVEKYADQQPELIATVHAYRGDAKAAFEWLEKAVTVRDPFVSTILTEPLFESLHDDPRWLPMLREIGYAPEQLAKVELNGKLPEVVDSAP